MSKQICIDTRAGQDCLEFSQSGTGPAKTWNFIGLQSFAKAKATDTGQPSLPTVNGGLFYVNQSAYGQLV